ncbi:hypothetical protein U1Q18_003405 [Sarracenia purpurea var. burkii]
MTDKDPSQAHSGVSIVELNSGYIPLSVDDPTKALETRVVQAVEVGGCKLPALPHPVKMVGGRETCGPCMGNRAMIKSDGPNQIHVPGQPPKSWVNIVAPIGLSCDCTK